MNKFRFLTVAVSAVWLVCVAVGCAGKTGATGGIVKDAPAPVAQPEKAVVAEVIPDSPAERAGLRPGDVFLTVDGEATGDVEALVEAGTTSALSGSDLALNATSTTKITTTTAGRPSAKMSHHPCPTMLRPGWPRLSHPGVAHAIRSTPLIAQVYRP